MINPLESRLSMAGFERFSQFRIDCRRSLYSLPSISCLEWKQKLQNYKVIVGNVHCSWSWFVRFAGLLMVNGKEEPWFPFRNQASTLVEIIRGFHVKIMVQRLNDFRSRDIQDFQHGVDKDHFGAATNLCNAVIVGHSTVETKAIALGRGDNRPDRDQLSFAADPKSATYPIDNKNHSNIHFEKAYPRDSRRSSKLEAWTGGKEKNGICPKRDSPCKGRLELIKPSFSSHRAAEISERSSSDDSRTWLRFKQASWTEMKWHTDVHNGNKDFGWLDIAYPTTSFEDLVV